MNTIFFTRKETEALFNAEVHSDYYWFDYKLTLDQKSNEYQGYKRLIHLRGGLNLLIRNYILKDILLEEIKPKSTPLELEFGFNLSGSVTDSQNCIHRLKNSFFQRLYWN